MTNQRPFVFEFVGLPGAGKTTVAEQLLGELSAEGSFCGSRRSVNGQDLPRLVHYLRLSSFYLRHLPELRAAARLTLAAPLVRPQRVARALKYVSVWPSRLALARRRGYQILILDQGVVQDAWSLMLRGMWRNEAVSETVCRTISTAMLPYCLVYFDLPVDIAVERMAQRPSMESSFDRLDRAEARRRLELQGGRLSQLFTRTVERTGVPHFRVDASRSVADICADVRAMLGTAEQHAEAAGARVTQ